MHEKFPVSLVKSSECATGRRKNWWIPERTEPDVTGQKQRELCQSECWEDNWMWTARWNFWPRVLSTTSYWRADRPWQLPTGLPTHILLKKGPLQVTTFFL